MIKFPHVAPPVGTATVRPKTGREDAKPHPKPHADPFPRRNPLRRRRHAGGIADFGVSFTLSPPVSPPSDPPPEIKIPISLAITKRQKEFNMATCKTCYGRKTYLVLYVVDRGKYQERPVQIVVA
jgi:hypothetical protein